MAKPVHTLDVAYIIELNTAFATLVASGDPAHTQAPIAVIAAAFCDPGLVELNRAYDNASANALALEITGQGPNNLDFWRRQENQLRRELRARLIEHHNRYRKLMHGPVEGDVNLPN